MVEVFLENLNKLGIFLFLEGLLEDSTGLVLFEVCLES